MSRGNRILVLGFLLLLGATAAVFMGPRVMTCLGPIGVTLVQCAKARGVVPDVGLGQPVLALTITIATLVIVPVRVGRHWSVPVGAVLGAVIGGAAFVALRPLTLEGFDSDGYWISIPRPLDTYALAAAVVVGALLGGIVLRVVAGVSRVMLARS